MPYPPTIPLADVDNTTPQVDRHPLDHNAITDALRDILNELGVDPSGSAASLTDRLTNIETDAIPAGTILMYAGGAAPSPSFVFCSGQAVSRAANPLTFARLGTTYGDGDGSTTFNLPDTRSAMPVGVGSTFATTLGEKGGSKDAIVITHHHSMPNHKHPFSATTNTAGVHDHNVANGTNLVRFIGGSSGGAFALNGTYGNTLPWAGVGVAGGGHAHTVSGTSGNGGNGNTDPTGSAGANKNLPPYIAFNFMIRLG